jgi:hypothetical protein
MMAKRHSPIAALLILGACHSYTYRLRGDAPDFQRVAIEATPHTSVRWSYLWGAIGDEWSPVLCLSRQPDGSCAQQVPHCDHGLGQVEVSHTAYSAVLGILTLGIVLPVRVRAWCATETGPHDGP